MDDYRTPNTALAAYLFSEGFTLLEVTAEPHPHNGYDAVFVFEDDPKIVECVHKWEILQAVGNLNIFYINYRKFVGKAKTAVSVAKL